MLLTCPHCGFSKQINQDQLPPDITRVNCPKCKQSFALQQAQEPTAQPEATAKRYQSNANEVEIDALPKAGFWMRLVATFIDAFIVFVL